MILKYGNITLRAIEKDDRQLLMGLMNDPRVERMTAGWNPPVSSNNQEKWIENYRDSTETLRWIIELDNGTTIGMIALKYIDWIARIGNIHYKVNPAEKNRLKGDTKNALYIAVKYAFDEMGLHRIEGTILDYNIMSIKLIKSVGFVQEGIGRSRIYKNGQWHDQIFLDF